MRAAVVMGHGGTDKIKFQTDYPDPKTGPHQVLVRVRAASINHHDIFSRRGMPGISIPLPLITGSDISGEIVQIGSEIERWKSGDRVLVNPIIQSEGKFGMLGETTDGGKAEFVAVNEKQLIHLPDSQSFVDAAALPLAYGAAHRMMYTIGQVREGETVLILGATGGVGVACVQLAKLVGAKVIASGGSNEKIARLREIGADHAFNYHIQDIQEAVWDIVGKPRISGSGGVDVAVNFTGGNTWHPTVRCITLGGRVLTCGATAGYDVKLDLRYTWTFEHQIVGSNGWRDEDLIKLIELGVSGRLKPVISKVFALEDTAKAEQMMEDRKVFGKIVVKP